MTTLWLNLTHLSWRWYVAVLGACVLIQSPRPSQACSIAAPPDAFFPNSGNVPANLPAVLWLPELDTDLDAVTSADVKFVRKVADSYEDVPFTMTRNDQVFAIAPDGGFVAGETYYLWSAIRSEGDGSLPSEPPLFRKDGVPAVDPTQYPSPNQQVPAFAELNATQEETYPTSLGTLVVSDSQEGPLTLPGGSQCIWTTNATTAVASLTLDSPWLDVMLLEATVDGDPYSKAPIFGDIFADRSEWTTRSSVRLDNICGDPYPLKLNSGSHTVKIVARVPGSDMVIESEPGTFELPMPDCSAMYLPDGGIADPVSNVDASVNQNMSGGVAITGGMVDAIAPTGGTQAAMDASTMANHVDTPAAPRFSSSCSTAPGGAAHDAIWLAVGLALVRRRKRTAATSPLASGPRA